MKTLLIPHKTLVLFLFTLLLVAPQVRAADFSEGTANFNAYFNNKILHTNASFMMPLYEMPQNAAFFVNPIGGFSTRLSDGHRHEERLSIGLGNRLYLPGEQFQSALGGFGGLFSKGIIFGGNWYLDANYSPYNNFFTKTGGGVEMLSDWIDLRFNGYIKLTNSKKLDKSAKNQHLFGTAVYSSGGNYYETLMPGFDAEAGFRLPIIDQLGEMKVFAGGFYYDAKHVKEIKGMKARFEWSPLPFINFGVSYFSNSRLNGEKWLAQGSVKLPLNMNALQNGHNPFGLDFTPKTGNLWKDRYTTPVLRNGMW